MKSYHIPARVARSWAWSRIGGLSTPGKFRDRGRQFALGWSIPADSCKTGSKLQRIAGTVCSICYALRGRYLFRNVRAAMNRRLKSLTPHQHRDMMNWAQAFTLVLGKRWGLGLKYFRWFDSGDLQSMEHLEAIVEVARRCPGVRFWLPTREVHLISAFVMRGDRFPKNLRVRVSVTGIGRGPGALFDEVASRDKQLSFSGVVEDPADPIDPGAHLCPAHRRQGTCGNCRTCWTSSATVFYVAH